MKNIPIGEVLKEYGYLTEEKLMSALAMQKEDGKKRLGQILIEKGFVTERQMLQALGKKLELQLIDLRNTEVNAEAVEKIPKVLAVKYNMLAIAMSGQRLTVVTSDPLNFYAQEDIRQITGMALELVLAEGQFIKDRIEYYYAEISAKMAAKTANISVANIEVPEMDVEDGEDEVPIIKLLNSLLVRGYSTNASDIHIEPFEDQTVVRMRVDGVIIDYVTLSKQLHQSLIARIKIMSNLDIAEKRVPQDGHCKVTLEGYTIHIRISVMPTVFGEKAVLRFLSTDTVVDRSGNFGMADYNYRKLIHMLHSPNGVIYITGPTGSGKTTTLYMVLDELAKRQVNISTIEDPVERNLARINQSQVNTAAGMTFEVGLRALLRQDPDIIMVGETRDAETASISVRAAITGHLVLSTLHTNDAISSIVRLEDMGVPKYLVANSMVGMVAQRLVRKVCKNCAYEDEPTEEEKVLLDQGITKVMRGRGCHQCNQTGYKGRIAIHEVFLCDKEVRKMIASDAEIDDIYTYAKEVQGMTSLRDSAMELVRDGVTTVEELLKATFNV